MSLFYSFSPTWSNARHAGFSLKHVGGICWCGMDAGIWRRVGGLWVVRKPFFQEKRVQGAFPPVLGVLFSGPLLRGLEK